MLLVGNSVSGDFFTSEPITHHNVLCRALIGESEFRYHFGNPQKFLQSLGARLAEEAGLEGPKVASAQSR